MLTDAKFLKDAFIQEGTSPAPGLVVACVTIGSDDDDPQTSVGLRRRSKWIECALDGDAGVSVDTAAHGAGYLLGESGALVRFDWRSTTQEALDASAQLFENTRAEDVGPLRRVRVLGKDVLCVGSAGQAYRFQGERFIRLARMGYRGEHPTIEDLAGRSARDFIAVTSDGTVAHFDGNRWVGQRIPCSASFTSVCEMADGVYAACAKGGIVIVGSAAGWKLLPGVPSQIDLWGIASHRGRLYVAGLDGIWELRANEAHRIHVPEDVAPSFGVLRGGSDGVWSFAEHTIGRVRGGRWTTVVQ